MNPEDLSEIMASLYLFYKSHSERLRDIGYSHSAAFWINFACLPFLPWSSRSEIIIRLSQVLRLYLGIYRYYIDAGMEEQREPDFIGLLRDRYYAVKDIVSRADTSQFDIEFELGRFILPRSDSNEMQIQAGLIILNTKNEWDQQKGREPLPCRFVEDI
jgi:hypothetical protein